MTYFPMSKGDWFKIEYRSYRGFKTIHITNDMVGLCTGTIIESDSEGKTWDEAFRIALDEFMEYSVD